MADANRCTGGLKVWSSYYRETGDDLDGRKPEQNDLLNASG